MKETIYEHLLEEMADMMDFYIRLLNGGSDYHIVTRRLEWDRDKIRRVLLDWSKG